jgi:hypothetical protein
MILVKQTQTQHFIYLRTAIVKSSVPLLISILRDREGKF